MNHLNIIRLLDYRFYIDIINSNSLKDTIVSGSRNVWNQQRFYINATSKNVDNLDDGYAIGSDKIVGDGKATYSVANT